MGDLIPHQVLPYAATDKESYDGSIETKLSQSFTQFQTGAVQVTSPVL